MPDESDETRRFSPADEPVREPADEPDPDATRAGDAPGKSDTPLDATQVDGAPVDPTVGRASVPAPDDDDTLPGGGLSDDTLDGVRRVPTVRDEPTVVTDRPGSTAVMPPVGDDDWAPSRANPAWQGRAEVRTPQPGRGYPEVDWTASSAPRQRDRWWMPIVVGLVALILLGVLGWAVYLLVNDSSNEQTPVPPAVSSAVTPSEETTTQTTTPSPTPTTTSPSPSPTPSTSEPTSGEVTIPALRGLALPEAQAALRSTGLNYRLIYRPAPDVPAGTVIDSDPVEGQEVPPDTTVTLVIAAEATTTPTTTGPTQDPGVQN